jgi:carbon monoxide dehydrogenase subunit G
LEEVKKMKIEGTHNFIGPREAVWDMFYDPQVLASALPGAQKMDMVNENEYKFDMNVRVGPVSGAFSGEMQLENVVKPTSLTLKGGGKGAPGFLNGIGNVKFDEQEDGTTLMSYEGEVNIGGALASVGQRMIDSVAKSMIRSGFATLDAALAARLEAKATGTEVDFKAPTEAEFAKSVAKDMVGGLTNTAETKLVLYIVPLVVVLILAAFLLSRCSGG